MDCAGLHLLLFTRGLLCAGIPASLVALASGTRVVSVLWIVRVEGCQQARVAVHSALRRFRASWPKPAIVLAPDKVLRGAEVPNTEYSYASWCPGGE